MLNSGEESAVVPLLHQIEAERKGMQSVMDLLVRCQTNLEISQLKLEVRVLFYQMIRRLILVLVQIGINNGSDEGVILD
jgi:hypothetical protein